MRVISSTGLDSIVAGYVHAATWTDLTRCDDDESSESGSEPYQYGPDDVDSESLEIVRDLCAQFVAENLSDVLAYVSSDAIVSHVAQHGEGDEYGQFGHDLRLTSCGHGTGFWDRFPCFLLPRVVTQDESGKYSSYVPAIPAMVAWATLPLRSTHAIGERLSAASSRAPFNRFESSGLPWLDSNDVVHFN